MKLHELTLTPGSKRPAKRIGRGTGSGTGKTAGKGHKGQNARSGGGVPLWFEGGQMRLTQRVRKRGFTNKFAKSYIEVSIRDLNIFEDGTEVTAELLKQHNIIDKIEDGIVLLGNGDLKKRLTVKAKRFTKSAEEKITSAGGKALVV